jgi:hypothetical protein
MSLNEHTILDIRWFLSRVVPRGPDEATRLVHLFNELNQEETNGISGRSKERSS